MILGLVAHEWNSRTLAFVIRRNWRRPLQSFILGWKKALKVQWISGFRGVPGGLGGFRAFLGRSTGASGRALGGPREIQPGSRGFRKFQCYSRGLLRVIIEMLYRFQGRSRLYVVSGDFERIHKRSKGVPGRLQGRSREFSGYQWCSRFHGRSMCYQEVSGTFQGNS